MKINLYPLIRHFQHHLHPLQEKSRSSFLVLSLITLFFCKKISGYLCDYNTEVWFQDFVVVERIAMLFLLLSVFKYAEKICWIATELLFFFLVQDVLDRLYFNIKEININDYITISLLSFMAILKKYKQYKNKQNDNLRTDT